MQRRHKTSEFGPNSEGSMMDKNLERLEVLKMRFSDNDLLLEELARSLSDEEFKGAYDHIVKMWNLDVGGCE